MFFYRDLKDTLLRFSKFPVVALMGPRQSGKTTLVKKVFPKHVFANLENPATRDFATQDPQRFLAEHENEHGLILDEFQYVPQILSYIQILVDEKKRPGYFVLTGSQNFLMNQAITQSLAGRVGIVNLLPLSVHELLENNISTTTNSVLLNGFYPRIYAENISPQELYPSYIESYVERDVRQIINIGDLLIFQRFIRLCAGRIGQLLNVTVLAADCGINRKTAENWLSLLASSYILFLLKPHFGNFNKRLTKASKLYFYDTGLACSLLGLRTENDVSLSPFRGPLFENLIIVDLYKQYSNLGIRPPLYFWRDQNGRTEVDCLIETHNRLIPIEIKSGQTISSDYFDGLVEWCQIAKVNPETGYVVYAGDQVQRRSKGNVLPWQHAAKLVEKIEKE